jgi:hypothetical protein
MRLLPTLAGLVIGFTVPALAQEKNTVDPEVRQQIEALDLGVRAHVWKEGLLRYDLRSRTG